MKFYERILQELEHEEHSFQTIYRHAFSFEDQVYFETNTNLCIERETYAHAQKHVLKLVGYLAKHTAADQVAALVLPNSPLWVKCFWALLRAGCKVLLLSPMMPAHVVKRCLEHTGCSFILGDMKLDGCTTVTAEQLLAELGSHTEYSEQDFAVWGDEVILATSSTTGEPKLLAFSGDAICKQILNSKSILKNCKEVARFDHGVIRMLAFLPFSHIFGLTACFLWFTMFGITFVFLNNLQPETILRTCRLHRVTHVFAVPLLWDTLANRVMRTAEEKGLTSQFERLQRWSLKMQDICPPLGRKFASVVFGSVQKQTLGTRIKYCISGGGMLSQNTLPLVNAIGYPLENGYGMTEIGVAALSNKRASSRKGLGIGKPMPSLEFKLDAEGQLLVRGRSCYTARYMNGRRIPYPEGEFFATGDLFEVNEAGEYSFISRMDDLVNGANGERLSPDAIENQMALTIDHCVFGGENGELALMLRLPEQCRFSADAWEDELKRVRAAIDRLPVYMRPRRIYLSNQNLPLSLSGKVRRQAIRRGVLDQTYPCEVLNSLQKKDAAQRVQMDAALVDEMKALFAAHVQEKGAVEADSHFFVDLGGDSLAFMELISAIEEKYQVKITNELSMEMTTPQAAVAAVLSCLRSVKQGEMSV